MCRRGALRPDRCASASSILSTLRLEFVNIAFIIDAKTLTPHDGT
jgi:hypothetical protein